jgi:tetratricopeptide (TPR) repeat protein
MDAADEDTTLLLVSDHGFKWGEFRRQDASDFHAKTGAMWHRPYGVFYAWGNGVAPGVRVAGADVYDIAPTVLAAMGYPAPEDMPGRVLTEVFEGGLAHETVKTYFGETRREKLIDEEMNAKSRKQELTPEQEAELERMRAIGYISGDRNDPANTKMNLGHRYLAQGRVEEALALFLEALQKQRNPGTLCSVAEALLRLGRKDEARKYVEEAIEIDPTDAPTQLLLARIQFAMGEDDAAEALVRAVCAAKPDLPYTHATLALILEQRVKKFEKAGEKERAEKARKDALEAHEAGLRLEPNQIPSLLSAAELILEKPGDVASVQRALGYLDRVVELRPKHASAQNNRSVALIRLGISAQRSGRGEEAKKRLEEGLATAIRARDAWFEQSEREYAKAWANRAYALWQLDRMADAQTAAEKARESEPSYVFAAPFLSAMTAAGRTLPPPAPKPEPPKETTKPK